jgi:hypothetical protein
MRLAAIASALAIVLCVAVFGAFKKPPFRYRRPRHPRQHLLMAGLPGPP